jgi:hypothetical protein
VIHLADGGYSLKGGNYTCIDCISPELKQVLSQFGG